MACTYLFLDEAGDFNFSPSGTKHFVLSSIAMRRPFPVLSEIDHYKHDCLEYGLPTEYFHCSEDNPHVRGRIFDIIARRLTDIKVDSLVVEKRKTVPALRADEAFYPKMLGYLIRHVLSCEAFAGASELIIITDTIPVNKKRRAIEKAIKSVLSGMIKSGLKYKILHHQSRSHYGLQLADYANWAIFRKWEKADDEFHQKLAPAIRSEFDIFAGGTVSYY